MPMTDPWRADVPEQTSAAWRADEPEGSGHAAAASAARGAGAPPARVVAGPRPADEARAPAGERPAYETVSLAGGPVGLRPWRLDDAPFMAAACVDPEIALFCMMPAGYTVALARDFIADAPRAWSHDGWLHLALTVAGDDRPVGAVGALAAEGRPGTVELGYWVMPGHRGGGLGRAGVALLTDWAFETLGLRRLVIGTMVANTASRRIARALGYRPEALLRSYRPFGDARTDCIVYSLLADEWRAAGAAAGGGEGRPAAAPPDEAFLPALAGARTDYRAAAPSLPAAPPPLGDGAILLRPYAEADVPDLVRACNDPEAQRWLFMLPTPYDERDAREFLARAAAGWEREHEADYAIADAASGRLLGGVALRAAESWAGVAELGYHVAPWARRRGVATAAARLIAQWSLDVLGMARVQILADTRNAASCGVATRLGFTREGLRRSDHGREGDLGDHAVFSLLAGDSEY
jgi:RimJ/RimL family protein N-acetyltransferase